jgi:hypothetical protein
LSGILATCAAAASIATVALAAKGPVQNGTFALFGGTATSTAELRSAPAPSGGGLAVRVRQFQSDGKTAIVAYSVTGERTMQMLLIRDDFATYAHLNTTIDATTGTFHRTVTGLDAAHRYYLYADSIPIAMKEQVWRFDLQDEHIAAIPPAATLAASAKSFAVAPYAVQVGDTTITANAPSQLLISVREKGKMAWDLQPYQGGPGFATMINAQTLDYIPLRVVQRGTTGSQARSDAMGGTPQTGPYMQAALPALPPGSYKLWVQFRNNTGKVVTAPFTIVAQ